MKPFGKRKETAPPLPERVITYSSRLGKHHFTFPRGHTFAEDAEKIVASYEMDSVTIHKAFVSNLKVIATYPDPEEEV